MKKRALCLILALLFVCACAACGRGADSAEADTTAADTTAAEETTHTASQADLEKASAVYAAFLGQNAPLETAYAADLNGDGYPELIGGKAEELMQQFSLTYTDKGGLCVQYPNAYSGLGVRFFVSDDNCFYYRDDGHTTGTAEYHSAFVYTVDDTGFVSAGSAYGEPWPQIDDYTDEIAAEMDAKYDAIFDGKLEKLGAGKAFRDLSQAEAPQDMDAYLDEALGIDIAAAREAYAAAQQALTQAITDAAGEAPTSVYTADYDRDGTYEAFAFIAQEAVVDTLSAGTVWFARADGTAEKIAEDVLDLDEMGRMSCAYHDYFQAPFMGGSASPTSVWEVRDGACRQVELFDIENCGMEVAARTDSVYVLPETIVSAHSEYDAVYPDDAQEEETGEPSGVGHTHKPYYFRDTPDGIKEYGGIEVQPADIEKITGGAELLALAQEDGRKLVSIFYRENGIVNFSFTQRNDEDDGTLCYCFNALLADGRLTLLTAWDTVPCRGDAEYLMNGLYAAAVSPDDATYPEAML